MPLFDLSSLLCPAVVHGPDSVGFGPSAQSVLHVPRCSVIYKREGCKSEKPKEEELTREGERRRPQEREGCQRGKPQEEGLTRGGGLEEYKADGCKSGKPQEELPGVRASFAYDDMLTARSVLCRIRGLVIAARCLIGSSTEDT